MFLKKKIEKGVFFEIKKGHPFGQPFLLISPSLYLLHFLDNGAECSGIVHR
jgi:hypothetical protein